VDSAAAEQNRYGVDTHTAKFHRNKVLQGHIIAFLVSVIVLGGGILVFDLPIDNPRFQEEIPRATIEAAKHALRRSHYSDEFRGQPSQTARIPESIQQVWLCIFALYLANYSVMVYFNVALASIALDRLSGGHSTLNDGLKVAWDRKGRILQWALLAATVGVVLRMLRREGRLGAWVAGFLGYAWSFGSFFVIPLLAAENISPSGALFQSAALIKEKWGESVSSAFSFRLLFLLLALPGLGLMFAGRYLGWPGNLGLLAALTYGVLLAIVVSALEQVVTAALYRYARTDQVSEGFSRTQFRSAWHDLSLLPS
jgi:Family of unknown function (DUF6159)